MVPELQDAGIDNTTRSRDNIYEYRDVPVKRPHTPQTLSRTVRDNDRYYNSDIFIRPEPQASILAKRRADIIYECRNYSDHILKKYMVENL